MKTDQNSRKYLSEYAQPEFTITKTELVFHLDEHKTRVQSRLSISRTYTGADASRDIRTEGSNTQTLKLDGINLKLLTISIDDVLLKPDQYQVCDAYLTLPNVADNFVFSCEVEIDPAQNTRLEGLYLSNGNFCTQCEAQGFRYITYYLDRPDVILEIASSFLICSLMAIWLIRESRLNWLMSIGPSGLIHIQSLATSSRW
jgi:aminopeptidase N